MRRTMREHLSAVSASLAALTIPQLDSAAGERVVVADLGVAADLPADLPTDLAAGSGLRSVRVRAGTANIARGPAMSRDEALAAVDAGRRLVTDEVGRGLDVVLTGDMGI